LGDIDPPKDKKKKKKEEEAKKKQQEEETKKKEGKKDEKKDEKPKSATTAASKDDAKKKGGKKEEEEENWATAKPKDAPLVDKKGNQVGVITLRIRREVKLYGTLIIDIKDAELIAGEEPVKHARCAKCVIKLALQSKETTVVEGKPAQGKNQFLWKSSVHQFEIDRTNHVFDVFIELREDEPSKKDEPAKKDDGKKDDGKKGAASSSSSSLTDSAKKDDGKKSGGASLPTGPIITGTFLCQARLTLYDTRSKFNTPLPLLTHDRKQIGQLRVQAKLKQSKSATKEAEHETKKAQKST